MAGFLAGRYFLKVTNSVRIFWEYLRRAEALPYVLVCLGAVLFAMNFLPATSVNPFPTEHTQGWDAQAHSSWYHPEYVDRFRSAEGLITYLSEVSCDSLELLERAAYVLRRRFLHAYSVYTVQENWIATLAGRFVWKDLSAKVLPEDIWKGNVAACSQVSIVFIDLCRKMGIPARRVSLKGHFACEAQLQGRWLFFDLDLKPNFSVIGRRRSLNEILSSGVVQAIYSGTAIDSQNVQRIFSSVEYGRPDEKIAQNAALFHQTTMFLSWYLGPITVCLGIFIFWLRTLSVPTMRVMFRLRFQKIRLPLYRIFVGLRYSWRAEP